MVQLQKPDFLEALLRGLDPPTNEGVYIHIKKNGDWGLSPFNSFSDSRLETRSIEDARQYVPSISLGGSIRAYRIAMEQRLKQEDD